MNGNGHLSPAGNKLAIYVSRVLAALGLGLAVSIPLAAQDFLKSWVPQRVFESDAVVIRSAVSPEGKRMAIQQKDGSIRVVDLEKRQTVKLVPRVADDVRCLGLGPDGDVLVIGAGKGVWVVDLAKDSPARQVGTLPSTISRVAVFPPRQLVAVSSSDGLRVLNLTSGDTMFSNTENPCLCLAFSPDGQTLVASQGKMVTLYELPNFIPRWKQAMNFFPLTVAFSQDATLLGVAGDSSNVVMAAVRDGQVKNKLDLGSSASKVVNLALTPDAKGLVASSGARIFVVDDVLAASGARREIKLDDKVTSLVLSSSTQVILASVEDGKFINSFATNMKLLDSMVMDFKPHPQVAIVKPVVEMLSPAMDTRISGGTIELLARVRTAPDQKPKAVYVQVDGRNVTNAQGGPTNAALPAGAAPLQPGEQLYSYTVPVPNRDCAVALQVETDYAFSRPTPLFLRGDGPAGGAASKPLAEIVQPVVTIVTPATETLVQDDAIQLILKVKSASDQKVQNVQIMVDGKQVDVTGGVRPKATPAELGISSLLDTEELMLYSVPLPNRDCTVMAIGQTPYSASLPAVVRLRRQTPVTVAIKPGTVAHLVEPVVEVLSPRNDELSKADVVNMMVKIKAAPDQKVTRLKVMVDGASVAVLGDQISQAPMAAAGGSGLLEEVHQISVPIAKTSCNVTVWGETAYNTKSEMTTVRVRREEVALPATLLRRPDMPTIVAPQVSVVTPQNDVVVKTDTVDLKVKVRYAPNQKFTGMRIFIDGQPVPSAAMRGARPRSDAPAAAPAAPVPVASTAPGGQAMLEELQDFMVNIPPKDCVISVIAESAMANSDLAVLKVRYQAARITDPNLMPKLYILAVGVSKYQDTSLALTFPSTDADAFSKAWEGQKKKLFRDVEVKTLLNENASRDNVMDGLEWLQKQCTQKDVAIAFFAGHGMNDPATGQFYYLPYNANLDAVKRTMVANSDIMSTLDALPGKRILFLDACHSSNVTGTKHTRGVMDIAQIRKEMESAGSGTVVFAAAAGRQGAQEDTKWGNGAFTLSLLEALKDGKADVRGTGRVTVNMLNAYITDRVKDLTNGSQTPIFHASDDLADFPLMVVGNVKE